MRAKKGLVAILCLMAILPTMLISADIDGRMASFSIDKVRKPVYQSISYGNMISDPTPDHIYSYAVDNWAYTEQLVEAFKIARSITGSQYISIVVAMVDGSFVAVTVDIDAKEITPVYMEDAGMQIFVTEEYLAAFVDFLDTDPSLEESKDFLLAEYADKDRVGEWYAVKSGRRLSYWFVVMLLSSLVVAASVLMYRRR